MTEPTDAGLVFIICIKPSPTIARETLHAQIATCLAVSGARVFIGLSTRDAHVWPMVANEAANPRVTAEVLDDRSLYDAWNRAADACGGNRLVFLGYGDCVLNPAHFERARLDDADVLFARALVFSPTCDRVFGRPFNRHIHYWRQRVALTGAIFSRAFVRRERFDPSLRIVGDWEFLLRASPRMRTRFVPLVVASMPAGGLSESVEPLKAEVRAVRARRRSGR